MARSRASSRHGGISYPKPLAWLLVTALALASLPARAADDPAFAVAELIEKYKTARVVKSAGPWDSLNEGYIYDGYVDKGLQFPVEASDPGAIYAVFL
jgi:hypothetical protein